jgi:four helix bundle protein
MVTSNKVTGDKLEFYGYKRLIAWQKADEFAHIVYKTTLNFPNYELFGLTSQLRRAVLSIVLNIVEGHARNNKKEFHRFLSISLGSLAEVEYLLEFAYECNYYSEAEYRIIIQKRKELGTILWKLWQSQG